MERSKYTTGFMLITLVVFTLFILSCQVSVKPDLGAKGEEPPEAPHHEGLIEIGGAWDSNRGVTYHIAQDGPNFTWEVVKDGKPTGEIGKGTIHGEEIVASWKGPKGSGEAGGAIVHVNPDGVATRIEWKNGVVFFR